MTAGKYAAGIQAGPHVQRRHPHPFRSRGSLTPRRQAERAHTPAAAAVCQQEPGNNSYRCQEFQQLLSSAAIVKSAASKLVSGLAAGALLLQSPAAGAMDFSAGAGSQVPITGGVNAVLFTEQETLSKEDIEKGAGARSAAAPAEQSAMAPQSPAAAAGSRSKVFFDVAVDGEAKGRIVVQLYDDVPIGAARFADLARGIQGVGFRRTKFDAVNEDFIRDAGLRRLNFGSETETPIAGGDGIDQLEFELEAGTAHRHSGAGDVSLVVRSEKPQDVKEKLVAYRGKLVKVQETLGEKPNGTAFAITLHAAPTLDATNLVVGKVVDGMETVKTLAALPAVKDNANSGYVKTAKLIGDRRADVAIRSFGRPFSKIIVAESGPLK